MLKICFLITSPNLKLLSLYILYINTVLVSLKINYNLRYNPTASKYVTLLKSPHVYKKHKEQFSLKTHSVCYSLEPVKPDMLQLYLLLKNKPKFIRFSFILER